MSKILGLEILLVIVIGLLASLLASINPQFMHAISEASYIWIGVCAIPVIIVGALWLILTVSELAEPVENRKPEKQSELRCGSSKFFQGKTSKEVKNDSK